MSLLIGCSSHRDAVCRAFRGGRSRGEPKGWFHSGGRLAGGTGTVFLPRRHGEHRGTARRSLKEWRGRGPKRPRRHLFQATFRLRWVAEGGANRHGERASGPSVVASEGPSLRPPPGAPVSVRSFGVPQVSEKPCRRSPPRSLASAPAEPLPGTALLLTQNSQLREASVLSASPW
jgi:hypothetical protein